MAEQKVYISDQDRKDLFDFILLNGGQVVPNLMYKTNEYVTVNDSSKFLDIVEKETVRFFILSNAFSTKPLIIEQNQFSAEPIFSINQRTGGPYINLALYRGFAEDATIRHKSTYIHIYPKYINPDNYFEEFKASEELKAYYKMLVKFLKSKCKSVQIKGKRYWIGKSTLEDISF